MKNQLKEWFPQHSEVLQAYDRVDFAQIFHDREQYMTDVNRARFEKIYKNFVENGQRPDTGDIGYILDVYTSAPDSRKKEILMALDATISVEQAMDTGLVSDTQLDTIIAPLYGDLYQSLDAPQKNHLRNEIRRSNLTLSVDDLDTDGIKNLWNKKELRDALKSSISEGIDFEKPKPLTGILGRIRERK
jgi:hypothetical protein